MATEMPVKDVLCEAMDYLSKLGSNLRTRSENLKEKKIRKDKLTNALAVQKAASKVLLICELSKKSLVNVETGVRKILEHIDVSQASSSVGGGKSSSSKSSKFEKDKKSDEKPKYHYFDYKSRKLKIKDKISLKHYRSMKVLAKKMSTFMLDKYPVYYDCKLYRIRRKKEQLKTRSLDNEQEESKTGNNQEYQATSDHLQDKSEPGASKINENRRSSEESVNRSSITTKSPLKKKTRNNIIDSDDQDESNKNEKTDGYINEDSDSHDKNGHNGNAEKESDGKNKNSKTKISDSNPTDKSCKEPELKKRKISKGERKQQNENIGDDDIKVSDCISEDMSSSNSKEGKNNYENRDEEENDSKKPVIKCVSLSKLLKPDVMQNVNKTKLSVPENVKKVIDKRLVFDINKKNEMLLAAKKKKDLLLAKKKKEVSAFKPKKFVINVTRLPDLDTEFLKKNNIKKIIKEGMTICEIEDKSDSVQQQTQKSKTEGKKTSEQSLELMALSDDPDEQLIAHANQIKISLLNESDSEDFFTEDRIKNSCKKNSDQEQGSESAKDNENSDQEKISNTQSDIDSDKDINSQKTNKKATSEQSKTISDSEAAKKYLLDKQDSDDKSEKLKNNKSSSGTDNNDLPLKDQKTPDKDFSTCSDDDNAKKSLLSDSSGDKTNVPLTRRKETIPQSKKKRIRESVQAKRALLRYSSGSETEDEQLRNTLYEIKLALLEGLSDDENQMKAKNLNEQHRSSQQSGSSKEDILEQVKKSSDSDSSSAIKKSNKCKKHLIKSDSQEKKNESSDDDPNSTSSSRKVRSFKKKA